MEMTSATIDASTGHYSEVGALVPDGSEDLLRQIEYLEQRVRLLSALLAREVQEAPRRSTRGEPASNAEDVSRAPLIDPAAAAQLLDGLHALQSRLEHIDFDSYRRLINNMIAERRLRRTFFGLLRRTDRKISYFVTRGDEANRRRDWPKAAANYIEAVARDPELHAIWVQLGHALKESGQVATAVGAYIKAIQIKPLDGEYHLQLGHALKIDGQAYAAHAAYLRARSLAPDLLDVETEVDNCARTLVIPKLISLLNTLAENSMSR